MAKKKLLLVIETSVEESEFDMDLMNDVFLMYGNGEDITKCDDVSLSWFEVTVNDIENALNKSLK